MLRELETNMHSGANSSSVCQTSTGEKSGGGETKTSEIR